MPTNAITVPKSYLPDKVPFVRQNGYTYRIPCERVEHIAQYQCLPDFYKIAKVDEDEFEKVVGDADTLAGMLLEIKGEFPALHEKVTYHHYEFEVLEMDSRRILKVKFTILPKDMEGSEEKE